MFFNILSKPFQYEYKPPVETGKKKKKKKEKLSDNEDEPEPDQKEPEIVEVVEEVEGTRLV